MKYNILREKLEERTKYPGTVQISRCPLINPGFRNSFNVSFGEDPLLNYQGGYVDFPIDFSFSTIQSCIRHQDIEGIINDPKLAWKYLGVFEMADIAGAVSLHSEPNHKDLARFQIQNMIQLFMELGLDINKIYPSYCAGGKVSELTKGKYTFDFEIPEDNLSKKAFIEFGVPEQNLIPDNTRDTFLSLNLDERPTGWGFRNEVIYNLGTSESPKYLDLATHEYLCWKPIYGIAGNTSSKNIIGLEDLVGRFSIAATGVERLNLVINNLERVQDVDYIKGFYDKLEKINSRDYIVGEILRTLHRIYSDVKEFNLELGTRKHNRRVTINKCLRNLPRELSCGNIRDLLNFNCETQPWHTNLHLGIEPTLERIKEYRTDPKVKFF